MPGSAAKIRRPFPLDHLPYCVTKEHRAVGEREAGDGLTCRILEFNADASSGTIRLAPS